jgi:hypothetical protein
MEFYGSIFNISGSVTASAFTGSYIGDGGGLYNLPASGVTGLNLSQISSGNATASISTTGFTVNKSTQIQGDLSVTGSIIATNYIVSSSVTYMTTSFASGSSMFGNDDNDVHQFTGSVQITGSISLNGQAIGTGKLDETTFQSYTSSNNSRVSALETSSGSLNSFTSSIDTTIKSKLNTENVISGSIQVDISGTTNYSTFSSSLTSSIGFLSSSIATTTLNTKNRVDSIENKTGSYATTGSNLFKGTQTHSGSILPSVDNAYDLGSAEYQWRDVYISSGSLYIDGTKVISSTAQELTITTDTGQSLKILEGTTDSIILQTADGDIELKSSADGDILLDPTNGKIMLKGPVEILNGQKIQSSVGGTPVVFANDIVVSGSIDITGTIEGINLTDFSSSVNTRIGNLESAGGNLNTFTASAINRLSAIETSTGSLNTFTSSINTTIKSKLDSDGVISGSSQVILTGTTGYSTFSSSVATSIGELSGSIATTTSGLSSSVGSLSSSVATTTLNQGSRLTSIEGKTGSYATTGSNIFQGNQTITGSLYVSQDLIIAGSSSIQHISSSIVNIADNIITVNAQNPSIRFGGLAVIDSGSSPQVSGSILFDSVNNQWLFVHQNQTTVTSSVLLMGPETYNNVGNEAYITANRLVKSTGIEHLTNSNISDDGTTVTILSNTVINGTISATGTTLVSGSSQVLNGSGVWSGSAQLPAGVVSGSSQITYSSISGIPVGIVSGSSQVVSLLPAGTVSGSSQVLNGTTIHSGAFFNGISVVSGSAQISFNGITDKPALVSGSSQITFGSISSIPGGLVSGSSQIDLTSTTNYASGILTRLNAVGVFSGSAQVTGIGNAQLTNSSFHVGTTSISLGRASASQTLTGVSVDGNAATAGGFTPSQSSGTANRIVVADVNGYIINNYFNASGGGSERNASGMGYFAGHNSSDYYYRSYTAAAAAALLSGQAMNINGTATNITAYTINQSVGTSNQPTFAGANLTDRLYLNGGSYEGSILFGSSTTWRCGIRQHDDADAELRIWTVNNNGMIFLANGYNGEPADIARPTDGLVVGPGNNVGIGNFSSSDPGYKLQVNGTGYFGGNLSTAAYMLIGGSYGDNAYSAVNSTRLMFGGGDSDAVTNYYIGTNKEDYGGNYTKLDLRWHTGIRMGAQAGYGGIRFYNNEDLSSVLFSIGASDGNVRSHTNLLPSANNSYNLGNSSLRWANLYTNDLHLSNEGKEGGNEIDGTTGDWTIQEGNENLYIINNKNGKKFKIDLTEIV